MRSSYFLPGALLALAGALAPLRAGPFNGETPQQSCVAVTINGIAGTPICTEVGESGDVQFSGGDVDPRLLPAPDTAVPESATSLLCGVGLIGMVFVMRKLA